MPSNTFIFASGAILFRNVGADSVIKAPRTPAWVHARSLGYRVGFTKSIANQTRVPGLPGGSG